MKKRFLIPVIFIAVSLLFAQSIKGKRIAVVEPKMENGNDNEKWIPLFVQGQVTTNFQNYSGLEVIDRQNIDKALKEQKLGTSAAYSEEGQIKIGELLTANYIVVISIIKKGDSYAIDAKINNAETNQTIGKAYNNANCAAAKLEDGSEINALSYNLLAGLGIKEDAIAALKDTRKIDSQKAEISANTNLAKGLALEKSDNGSIVEAMAYYQKAMSESSKITESEERFNSMTTNLSVGNIREKAVKRFQLRDEWEKIWKDFNEYAKENCPCVVTSDIYEGASDYVKKTLELKLSVAYSVNPVVANLYSSLIIAYKNLEKNGYDSKNWNIVIEQQRYYESSNNKFYTSAENIIVGEVNEKYRDAPYYSYIISVELFDDDEKNIGKQNVCANVSAKTKEMYIGRDSRTDKSILIYNSPFNITKEVVFIIDGNNIPDNPTIKVTTDKSGGVVYTSSQKKLALEESFFIYEDEEGVYTKFSNLLKNRTVYTKAEFYKGREHYYIPAYSSITLTRDEFNLLKEYLQKRGYSRTNAIINDSSVARYTEENISPYCNALSELTGRSVCYKTDEDKNTLDTSGWNMKYPSFRNNGYRFILEPPNYNWRGESFETITFIAWNE